MSTLTKITTAVTGNTITADVWNDEFDQIYSDYNGGITNANISSSAAISESKISFAGTSGQYPSSDGDGTLTWGSIAINRAFTWGFLGTLTTGDEQGMKFISPVAMTVTNLRAKTGSGTATIRIQTGTTNIDASASITSTAGNITSFDSTAIAAGDVVTLDITAVSSGVDLFVTLENSAP